MILLIQDTKKSKASPLDPKDVTTIFVRTNIRDEATCILHSLDI